MYEGQFLRESTETVALIDLSSPSENVKAEVPRITGMCGQCYFHRFSNDDQAYKSHDGRHSYKLALMRCAPDRALDLIFVRLFAPRFGDALEPSE